MDRERKGGRERELRKEVPADQSSWWTHSFLRSLQMLWWHLQNLQQLLWYSAYMIHKAMKALMIVFGHKRKSGIHIQWRILTVMWLWNDFQEADQEEVLPWHNWTITQSNHIHQEYICICRQTKTGLIIHLFLPEVTQPDTNQPFVKSS